MSDIISQLPDDKSLVERTPLNIFRTEADRYDTDLFAMSDFFGGYVQQLSVSLRNNTDFEILSEIPVADISVITDVVRQADIILKGNTTWIPDFDSLPKGILSKLKKGIYTIGASKQVEGNARATILDENGVRIKDITLKRVPVNPGNIETIRNIGNQMQMRQIYAKLSEIQELQAFQIERDRDRDIFIPFFEARSLVLEAENANNDAERTRKLRAADDSVRKALIGVYTDITTTSKSFAKKTKYPFASWGNQLDKYSRFIIEDLQAATKMVGVRLQLLDYLGEHNTAKEVLLEYEHVVYNFITKAIDKRGKSAAVLLQGYTRYNKSNLDCWYRFIKETKPVLESSIKNMELGSGDAGQTIYIISGGENSDEEV